MCVQSPVALVVRSAPPPSCCRVMSRGFPQISFCLFFLFPSSCRHASSQPCIFGKKKKNQNIILPKLFLICKLIIGFNKSITPFFLIKKKPQYNIWNICKTISNQNKAFNFLANLFFKPYPLFFPSFLFLSIFS